jgi:ketosteroid isomerase-like protein
MRRLLAFCIALVTTAAFAQSPVDSLVAADRAFAKRSHDTNVRDAFLAYFADKGIVFNPGPVNAKALYSSGPPSPSPSPVTLDWTPAYAEVAQSGQLGFTTGPYIRTDNVKKAVTAQGTFFSVWEKQASGEWKVILDCGVPTSTAANLKSVALKTGTPSAFHAKAGEDMNAEMMEITAAEKALALGTLDVRMKAYDDSLSSNAFVVQDGLKQIADLASRAKHLSDMKLVEKWILRGGTISSSQDMAYVYGVYEGHTAKDPTGQAQLGPFARVWKRDAQGKWKILVDTTQSH